MQRFTSSQRHEPHVNYRYSVHMYTSDSNFIQLGFNHVTGIDTKLATERMPELGNPAGRRRVTGVEMTPVTLTHGVCEDQQLIQRYVSQFQSGVIEPKPFPTVFIRLHDRANNPRIGWVLYNAMIEGMSWGDLDGLSAEVLLENITLSYDSFALMDRYPYRGTMGTGMDFI